MDLDYSAKVIVLGDNEVGKSCLFHRFVSDTYRGDNNKPTIRSVPAFKQVKLDDKTINLSI